MANKKMSKEETIQQLKAILKGAGHTIKIRVEGGQICFREDEGQFIYSDYRARESYPPAEEFLEKALWESRAYIFQAENELVQQENEFNRIARKYNK